MRKLHYSGASVIVSDQVCKAILRYSRALARAQTADLIIMPVVTEEMRVGVAHMIVGPSSQILSVPTDDVPIDLEDGAMVEILESRTRKLDPSTPDWDRDIVDVEDFTNFDWGF